jgi:glycosyltransferase involved in cell wall biosynthesis
MYANHIAARVARELDIPLVVSPRGMLEEWALAYRGWKKRLAWQWYQAADLHSAQAFCATSHEEARQLRELGFSQPIAVIPNGIDMPQRTAPGPAKIGDRKVLFLSRIHPKKGLLDLVEAWAALRPAGWQLIIAGPDEDGYTKVVKAAVVEAALDGAVHFLGEVSGEEKQRLWQQADLFVLPTYSENFGIVIAEALAWRIPVITTRGAPWSDLIDWKCGWWIDQGEEALRTALASAIRLSDAERQAMGENGSRLVQEKFDWAGIARDMAAFYRWLLGVGQRPGNVLLSH